MPRSPIHLALSPGDPFAAPPAGFAPAPPNAGAPQLRQDQDARTTAADAAVDRLPPRGAERLEALRTDVRTAEAVDHWPSIARQQDRLNAAKFARESYLDRAGPDADPREIKRMDAEITREQATLRTLQAQAKKVTASKNGVSELLHEVEKIVARGMIGADVEVNVPDGTTIESQRKVIADLYGGIDQVKRSWPPLEEVLADEKELHDRKAKAGAPDVECGVLDVGRGMRERLKFVVANHWPQHFDGSKSSFDSEAFIRWLAADQIWADAERQLRSRYENFSGLVLDDAEKANRLREMNDQLLEAERIEGELIWRAIGRGEAVTWRGGMSPRAALGVN
jgi:hypothetical protein